MDTGIDKSDMTEYFSSELVDGWYTIFVRNDTISEYLIQFYDIQKEGKDSRPALFRISHYSTVVGKRLREMHSITFVIDRTNHTLHGVPNAVHHVNLDGDSKIGVQNCQECLKYLKPLDHLEIPSTQGIGAANYKIEKLEKLGEYFLEELKKKFSGAYALSLVGKI